MGSVTFAHVFTIPGVPAETPKKTKQGNTWFRNFTTTKSGVSLFIQSCRGSGLASDSLRRDTYAMIAELLLRFFVGGIVVSLFAMLGGAVKPKSFAGLFGAAPSVALATLTLTFVKKGRPYATVEAESMILGATAFLIYALVVCRVLMRGKYPVLMTTTLSLVIWLTCALGLWLTIFR
jgi:hypothetical protein